MVVKTKDGDNPIYFRAYVDLSADADRRPGVDTERNDLLVVLALLSHLTFGSECER